MHQYTSHGAEARPGSHLRARPAHAFDHTHARPQIRRSLLETLSDCAYNAVASFHSDSAVSFALFLNHLPDVRSQQPPDVLIKAMQVCAWVRLCLPACRGHGEEAHASAADLRCTGRRTAWLQCT